MDALLSEEFYAENFVFIDICYPDLSEYAKCYVCLCPESVQFKFLKVLLRTYSRLVLILVIQLIH